MKDLGLNLRPVGLGSEPSVAFKFEAGFAEFRGKADLSRCAERRGDGEPATASAESAGISREVELSGCVSGASIRSALPDISCTSLSSLGRASFGEGALKASAGSSSRVEFGLIRADCLGRGLILGGIADMEVYQWIICV